MTPELPFDVLTGPIPRHQEAQERPSLPRGGDIAPETTRRPFAPQTLTQARTAFERDLPDGTVCPCCDRYGRIQPRRLNSAMAAGLVWLAFRRFEGDGYVDVPATAPRWLVNNRELPRLQLWGLVASARNDDPAKRCSGRWAVTTDGYAFAKGELQVRSHVLVYNRRAVAFDGELVTVHDCLASSSFDYAKLRAGG